MVLRTMLVAVSHPRQIEQEDIDLSAGTEDADGVGDVDVTGLCGLVDWESGCCNHPDMLINR